MTAAKKIGGDVDIVVAGFSLESTVGKEAAAVAGVPARTPWPHRHHSLFPAVGRYAGRHRAAAA